MGKKLIELTEKALDTMQLPGFEETQEMSDAFAKVAEALAERRKLEQTPITEEWLKEHGFTPNSTLYKWERWAKDNGTFLSITREYGKWYITDTCIEVSSLANLYDALELCNIEID